LFGLGQGWQNFWGHIHKLWIIFGEILLRMETRVYYHHICDYSSDVLLPVTGWHPRQLPGWPIL
jgi:hypothetical protein